MNPSVDSPAPFSLLGRAIAEGRGRAGFARQKDLATALEVRQQSVSRWEAGTHRPSLNQIGPLAKALGLPPGDLLRMADYEAPSAMALTRPLPLDALDPESFEQYVAVHLDRLKPRWNVHRLGKSGHTQGGADVVATDPQTGRRLGVQCKRMRQFGPAQVEAAVRAFPEPMEEKVLALSRIASPQARAEMARHKGWLLWDQDDLTRQFRAFAPHVQDQIVETFFGGRNLELLGRSRVGPWQDAETFFRPFSQPGALFTHEWALFGRDDSLAELEARLGDASATLTFLVAPGGMGKSRLLLEAVRKWRDEDPVSGLWFLSTVSDVTRADLAALGPGPKVIVVDDAHDRDTLGAVFEYVAQDSNQARLVLATRPYALSRLVREASVFGLEGRQVELETLNHDDLRELAKIMLAAQDKPDDWAEPVVGLAGGSPLIVAMAVRILSREEMAPERIRAEQGLRDHVLGRFARVVSGRLGPSDDAGVTQKILEILALVQPFHPEDSRLLALIETVHGISQAETERVLTRLVEGGVVLRRGPQHRLMPDVLGDYLIDESCLANGRLSRFAQDVLAATAETPTLLRNIVLNLGRLDWRHNDGATSDSRLLDAVWRSFEDIVTDYDGRLDAVRAVAVYQPRQALEFVSHMIRRGVALNLAPEILRDIAYTADFLDEALTLLWDMARRDDRKTGPHPGHPMRVLHQMAAIEDGKPIELIDALFNFALRQAEREDVWDGAQTPIGLLQPFLATEGVRDHATARTITMEPYQLLYDFLQPYRAQVIDTLFRLMQGPNPVAARLAALAMGDALRGPFGLMGSTPSDASVRQFEAEFVETLGRLESLLRSGVREVVAIGLAGAAAWHADHGGATKAAAQRVLDALPSDADFRISASLIDGWGNIFLDRASDDWADQVEIWMAETAAELARAYPVVTDRLAYLEARLAALHETGVSLDSAHVFFQAATHADPDLARALIEAAEACPGGRTDAFVGAALFAVRRADPVEARGIIDRWLDGDRAELRRATPGVIWGEHASFAAEDVDQLRRMLQDRDPIVVIGALRSLRVSRPPDAVVLNLALTTPLDDPQVLEQVATVLGGRDDRLVRQLSEAQVDALLQALEPLERLEGHWINQLISQLSGLYPRRTAAFFRARVLRSVETPFAFRPANWGAWRRSPLQFDTSAEASQILAETWEWLRQNWDRGFEFRYGAAHMFEAMFLQDAGAVVRFFEPQLATAQRADLEMISALLRDVDYSFILDETDFITRYVEQCASFDADLVETVGQRLYGAATSGMYRSVPGEPSSRDTTTLERVKAIQGRLSRVSAAWTLYQGVREHAERNIERARHEGEMMDD